MVSSNSFLIGLRRLTLPKDVVSLALFKQLKSLTIRQWDDENWGSLASILQSVTGRLEELFISLSLGIIFPRKTGDGEEADPGFNHEGLEVLDPVLQQERFTNLRVVEFYLRQVFLKPLSEEREKLANVAAVDAFHKKLQNLFKKVAVKIVVRWYVTASYLLDVAYPFDADTPTLAYLTTQRRTRILGRTRDGALTRCLFMAVCFSDGDPTYTLAVLGHVSTRL